MTVLLADDDAVFLRGLREALDPQQFAVVGETEDATSALSAAARLQPDICLIERKLAGEGANAVARIAKTSPHTLIILLSYTAQPDDVIDALNRGASGYLLKSALSGERLGSTLLAAYSGEPALSRALIPHLVDAIRQSSTRRISLPTGQVTLTPREWEVAELLQAGNSTAAIADRLGVSPVTVRRHVGLLLRKLGAESRKDAIQLIRAHARR